jgi:hypothetical protein
MPHHFEGKVEFGDEYSSAKKAVNRKWITDWFLPSWAAQKGFSEDIKKVVMTCVVDLNFNRSLV